MIRDDRTGYGILGGKLVFVADVSRGLACGCVCARCGKPLVAKKGPIRRKHFAHHEISDCLGSSETVLHLLSKELIAELKVFVIPPYDFEKQRRTKAGMSIQHKERVAKGGQISIRSVRVESGEDGFIPDVIIDTGSKSLIVEIAVTHKVARAKLRNIRRRDLPAIEIQLEPNDSLLPRAQLKEKLRDDLASKSWIFHPAQREAERRFVRKFRNAIGVQRRSRNHMNSQFVFSGGNEYDRTQEVFRRVHGRYPSTEECLRLWPHLWKPRGTSRRHRR
ncbi:MAG: competence protein CoiA family protein [Betaproteobacteria bacterium]